MLPYINFSQLSRQANNKRQKLFSLHLSLSFSTTWSCILPLPPDLSWRLIALFFHQPVSQLRWGIFSARGLSVKTLSLWNEVAALWLCAWNVAIHRRRAHWFSFMLWRQLAAANPYFTASLFILSFFSVKGEIFSQTTVRESYLGWPRCSTIGNINSIAAVNATVIMNFWHPDYDSLFHEMKTWWLLWMTCISTVIQACLGP